MHDPRPAHPMTRLTLRLTAIVVLLGAVGCRGQATNAVRALVDSESLHLRESPAVIRDPAVDGYLDELGALVLDAARELEDVDPHAPPSADINVYDRFDVVLVHSTTLNAWVYGDDFTCVTSNLVLHAEQPEEIVAVLCHEFAHLRDDHLIEAKEREIGHMAVGGLIEVLGVAAELAATMYGMPIQFSAMAQEAAQEHRMTFEPGRPEDEFEADAYGFKLYRSMGLDVAVYDDLFERLVDRYGDHASDSHPSLGSRVDRMQETQGKHVASAPHRELDEERLRTAQRRLSKLLIDAAAARRLVAHEQVARARNRSTPQATACGLLNLDPAARRGSFVAALKLHDVEPKPEPQPEAEPSPASSTTIGR